MAATTERVEATRQEAEWRDVAHTGPDTLAGRYMRHFWQPVYLSEDLLAGRAKPIRIMSEDFTLYRGEGGAAHLVAFRCAHRGTQLSTGWVEGDEIRCFYHGWKYDGSGQCTEQPAEPEPFCSRIRIRSYPVQEYLGLIWGYLGEGEAPAFRRFPQWEQESGTAIRVAHGGRVAPYSWVNIMENDPAHVPFVHRDTAFFQDIPQVSAEETEYGSKETVTFTNRVGYVHRVMPNGRSFVVPTPEGGWTENLIFQVPVDDESHLGFGIGLNHLPDAEAVERFHERIARFRANADPIAQTIMPGGRQVELGAKVLCGELRIEDVEDRQIGMALQDLVSQWGQGEIRDKSQDHLGRSDAGVVMLRGLWERDLRALAEGRAPSNWVVTERIELTPDYHG
jgi:5,5'-dehydrodivanillate O-demethylase